MYSGIVTGCGSKAHARESKPLKEFLALVQKAKRHERRRRDDKGSGSEAMDGVGAASGPD